MCSGIVDGDASGIDDVRGCREIRLAGPEADDRMSGGAQGVCLVRDRQRCRRFHAERSS